MVSTNPVRKRRLLRYGVAPPLVTLAALLQWALLGDRAPFILILPTIMAVAWYGGLGPGLLATALGALEAAYLFFDPLLPLQAESLREVLALVVFGFLGIAISMQVERLQQIQRARRQAERQVLLDTKHTLRDREERLQAILETAADAIITIDHRGIIQSVNAATERMFGYAAAEMIGQSVNMLMTSPYREEHDAYLAKYLQTGEKHIIGISRQVEVRRKDGSVFATELAVSEIPHLKLFTGIHRDLTERKQLERDVVEAASLEQWRIGQDLHDTVAQELTALNLLVTDLAETLQIDPAKTAQLVGRLEQGLQRSQQGLRAVLRGLLPVAVDSGGLMAALSDLADRTRHEGKANCTFDCPEPVTVADNLTATQLYFITQEAVYNAVKHARAKTIRIRLSVADSLMVLRVQDDGIGMSFPPAPGKGLGLRIMGNRAAILGARLTIEPATPTGTAVTCALERKNDGQKNTREPGPGLDRR